MCKKYGYIHKKYHLCLKVTEKKCSHSKHMVPVFVNTNIPTHITLVYLIYLPVSLTQSFSVILCSLYTHHWYIIIALFQKE